MEHRPAYYEHGSKIYTYEVLNGGKMQKPKYVHRADMKAFFGTDTYKVIAMSDIHSVTNMTVDELIKKNIINKTTVVITTGDMAGIGITGKDGDHNPYDDYVKILKAAYLFYFVQGNHDIYDARVFDLINSNGTPCCVHNKIVDTVIGKIAGVNGIIVPDHARCPDRHKYNKKEYNTWVNHLKDKALDIFLTHMPPSETTLMAPIHMFGHCHAKKYYYHQGKSLCLNMDSRVIIF